MSTHRIFTQHTKELYTYTTVYFLLAFLNWCCPLFVELTHTHVPVEEWWLLCDHSLQQTWEQSTPLYCAHWHLWCLREGIISSKQVDNFYFLYLGWLKQWTVKSLYSEVVGHSKWICYKQKGFFIREVWILTFIFCPLSDIQCLCAMVSKIKWTTAVWYSWTRTHNVAVIFPTTLPFNDVYKELGMHAMNFEYHYITIRS